MRSLPRSRTLRDDSRALSVLGLIVALASLAGSAPSAGQEGFTDIAADVGVRVATHSGSPEKRHIRETLGQGACFIDHNGDGALDLFVPNGATRMAAARKLQQADFSPWTFYVRDGARFREAAQELDLAVRAWGIGCAVGDVDGDGWDDLFVTTAESANRLFRNTEGRGFEDVTERSGTGSLELSTSAAFGDLDGDGDLDLFVATYLDEAKPPPRETCLWRGITVMCGPHGFPQTQDLIYWNDGRGVFTETPLDAVGFGLGVMILDTDLDGDEDVYVANDSSPNHLWQNAGNGVLRERGFFAGVALSVSGKTQAGMGVDAGDLDGDGLLEIVVTNFSHDVNNVFHSVSPGQFTDWSHRVRMAEISFQQLGWSVLLEDFDLDGDVDVFIANGHVFPGVDEQPSGTSYAQPLQLLVNDGSGELSAGQGLGPMFERPILGRGAALADWDDDGDLDIVVTRDGEVPLLLQNDLPRTDSNWLRVRLRGRAGNPHGIGARIELETMGRTHTRYVRVNRGYLSASEPSAHFGLGTANRVDRLTVAWPGGTHQTLRNLDANRVLELSFEDRSPR